MTFRDKLICVEEKLNKRKVFHIKNSRYPDIESALRQRKSSQRVFSYVMKLLPERGFHKKDNKADGVGFYKYARISPDVWSTFKNNVNAPSKETLWKIAIALRLNGNEAEELFFLADSGFQNGDFRDEVILACIECGYYEIEDVYEILEEYGSEIIDGKRRFENIYSEQ